MTAYSKICPKCQKSCDLAASSCKKCGLRFGAVAPPPPGSAPGANSAPEPSKSTPAIRAAVMVFAFGGVLIVAVTMLMGAIQQQVQQQKQVEVQRRDTEKHSRAFHGRD